MDGLNIITVIAIILFARLGLRLFHIHKKAKEEKSKKTDKT
jgi:hypothetical protein